MTTATGTKTKVTMMMNKDYKTTMSLMTLMTMTTTTTTTTMTTMMTTTKTSMATMDNLAMIDLLHHYDHMGLTRSKLTEIPQCEPITCFG